LNWLLMLVPFIMHTKMQRNRRRHYQLNLEPTSLLFLSHPGSSNGETS